MMSRTSKRFLIRPRMAELELLMPEIVSLLAEHHLPPRLRHDVEAVIEEVVTNVVRHGGDGTTFIRIAIGISNGGILLEFGDDARPFDPTIHEDHGNKASTLAELPIGGLGLGMIRRAADTMHYERCGETNAFTVQLRRDG